LRKRKKKKSRGEKNKSYRQKDMQTSMPSKSNKRRHAQNQGFFPTKREKSGFRGPRREDEGGKRGEVKGGPSITKKGTRRARILLQKENSKPFESGCLGEPRDLGRAIGEKGASAARKVIPAQETHAQHGYLLSPTLKGRGGGGPNQCFHVGRDSAKRVRIYWGNCTQFWK